MSAAATSAPLLDIRPGHLRDTNGTRQAPLAAGAGLARLSLSVDKRSLIGPQIGRTVMIGVPLVTRECTTVEPPKTLWVQVPSAAIATASVMMPD
mgnify:CR=1 FL=1